MLLNIHEKITTLIVSISLLKSNYIISILNQDAHIDSTKIDKLFDKFYRVDKARQRNNSSTGLGLSIVKNILTLHNFKFSLKNVNNGVEFIINIPKADIIED